MKTFKRSLVYKGVLLLVNYIFPTIISQRFQTGLGDLGTGGLDLGTWVLFSASESQVVSLIRPAIKNPYESQGYIRGRVRGLDDFKP